MTAFRVRGFTLVEILVAMSIIAILSAVAVPNLKKFSSDQEITNAASRLRTILITAQSQAISRIQCPTGSNIATDAWIVRLNSLTYSLIAKCQTGGDITVSSSSYSSTGLSTSPTFTADAVEQCPSNPVDIIFSGNQTYYQCSGGQVIKGDVTVNLRGSGQTQIVKIGKGGIIRVE